METDKRYSELLKNFKTGGMSKEAEVSDVANDEDRFLKEEYSNSVPGTNSLSNLDKNK